MKGWKNNNDPWEPVPSEGEGIPCGDESRVTNLLPLPQNPLHDMIDSQQYIQSLERKLEKLKKKKDNPSSKEIINSLALFSDDQMRNYVNSESSTTLHDMDGTDRYLTPSYVGRRLFPEHQAINAAELAELVKEDFVAKEFEELTLEDKTNSENVDEIEVERVENSQEIGHESDKEDSERISSNETGDS